uniref:Uncharacterized protein n=1 Tax=Anguilla anguilla TaxID=7936 RepID=A0A0E9W0W6_ANGAN
MLGPEKRTRSS